ncbi:hypothetical protein E2320_002462 [Naja naja]|nr:hypothetical protein E2320_002462 [Naja naja]
MAASSFWICRDFGAILGFLLVVTGMVVIKTEQGKYQKIMNSSRVHVTRNTSLVMMQIYKLQHADNGIYHCKIKDSLKPSFVVLNLKSWDDRKDASGEDHTYEGLTVTLFDTYEDIGVSQDRPEKWDLGEHPCEELKG